MFSGKAWRLETALLTAAAAGFLFGNDAVLGIFRYNATLQKFWPG